MKNESKWKSYNFFADTQQIIMKMDESNWKSYRDTTNICEKNGIKVNVIFFCWDGTNIYGKCI